MSEKSKHIIRLKNFEFPNGEIPFTVLSKITEQLKKVSEGALRLYIDGFSSHKAGRQPEWLEKSLDFTLSGIKKGSTVLEVKAPLLTDTVGSYQTPLHEDLGIETLEHQTAIGLAMAAYERATVKDSNTDTLDKNLLKVMLGFNNFFGKDSKAYINIQSTNQNKKIKIAPKTLQKIQLLEENTPADQHIKITGKLEMMRHSSNQLELVNISGKFKAYLESSCSFDTAKEFFGKDVTCTGVAHFNPKGKITSFEISAITMADTSATYFLNAPAAIQQVLDLPNLAYAQNYKGTSSSKLNKVIDDLEIDDDIEELLNALNS